MKKIVFSTIILVTGFLSAQTQSAFIQEIKGELSKMPADEQVRELILFSRQNRGTDSTKALWSGRYAVKLATKYQSEKLDNALLGLGHAHKSCGHYDSARFYYKRVLELDSVENVANAFLGLGSAWAKSGDFTKALEAYQKAVDFYRSNSDSIGLGKVYSNIGNIYNDRNLNQYGKAVAYYERSLEIFRAKKYPFGGVLLNMAFSLRKLNKLDSALFYLHMVDSNVVASGTYIPIKTYAYIVEGKIYSDRKEYGKALTYFNKADSLIEGHSMVEQQLDNSASKGWAYFYLGDYNKAIQTAFSTLNLMQQAEDFSEEASVKLLLGKAFAANGDHKRATAYLSEYIDLKEELTKAETLKQIREVEAKYETREKQSQIEVLQLQNELSAQELAAKQANQNALIALLGLLIIGGGSLFYYYNKNSLLKRELLESEISDLKARIKSLVEQNVSGFEWSLETLNNRLETPLTAREFEVLKFALGDKSNREIAAEIHISINTVKYHLKNIYEKLGVSNRKEVISFLVEE